MYFSKVQLPTGADYFFFLKESNYSNLYHAHQLLWKMFPNNPVAQRDFLFREQQVNNQIYYYLVSERKPESVFGLEIQTKDYFPKISKGDLYRFSLRANPVITRKSLGKKNSVQHDVLMDAKKEAREKDFSKEVEYNHIRNKTINWLQKKAEANGFSIIPENVSFDQYRQHTLYKKNKQQIKFSTVDYYGILEVDDTEMFKKSLFYGIGKKKAFGCGLLLIKPI
ncbi:MAG: type I-E CRISPR-associated protein Cas6/Cse3/CasE [Candidatus Cloacimonetes bacterium]|nr:type I-E CRISPR-associated protein Cas6/Cse3/CasE [Candidatus Cloacimonadota bacterium]